MDMIPIKILFTTANDETSVRSKAMIKFYSKIVNDEDCVMMMIYKPSNPIFNSSCEKQINAKTAEIVLIEENLTVNKSLSFSCVGKFIKWWNETTEFTITSQNEEFSSFLFDLIEVGQGKNVTTDAYQLDSEETDENEEEQEQKQKNNLKNNDELCLFDPPPFNLCEYEKSRNNLARDEFVSEQLSQMLKYLDEEDKSFESELDEYEEGQIESPENCKNYYDDYPIDRDDFDDDQDELLLPRVKNHNNCKNKEFEENKNSILCEKIIKNDNFRARKFESIFSKKRNDSLALIFPPPTKDNLINILETLSKKVKKKDVIFFILKNSCEWLHLLQNLFIICEKTNEEKNIMFTFYKIYKEMIELNDKDLLLNLVSEDFYTSLFGALEYNPCFPLAELPYRKELDEGIKIKNSILVESEDIISIAKVCYRLGYLKDSVVNTNFEESTISKIAEQWLIKNMELIRLIVTTPKLYSKFFNFEKDIHSIQILEESKIEINQMEERLNFFLECVSVLKFFQFPTIKTQFFHQINRNNNLIKLLRTCLEIPSLLYSSFSLTQFSSPTSPSLPLLSLYDPSFPFPQSLTTLCSLSLSLLSSLSVLFSPPPLSPILPSLLFILLHSPCESLKMQISHYLLPQSPNICSLIPYLSQPESFRSQNPSYSPTCQIILNLLTVSSPADLEEIPASGLLQWICRQFWQMEKYVQIAAIQLLVRLAQPELQEIREAMLGSGVWMRALEAMKENKGMLYSTARGLLERIKDVQDVRRWGVENGDAEIRRILGERKEDEEIWTRHLKMKEEIELGRRKREVKGMKKEEEIDLGGFLEVEKKD